MIDCPVVHAHGTRFKRSTPIDTYIDLLTHFHIPLQYYPHDRSHAHKTPNLTTWNERWVNYAQTPHEPHQL